MQRVVDVRNQIAHSTGGITKDMFEKMWKDLEEALLDLGHDTTLLAELRASPLKVCLFFLSPPFYFFIFYFMFSFSLRSSAH